MRHVLGAVALVPERLGEPGEVLRGLFRQRLTCLARPQPFRVGHGPLELVADGTVHEIVKFELVRLADRVGPVRPDPEPAHVRNDQQGRVLERERVLPQLVERGVEVRVLPLVLPREAVALPHVRPAFAAGVLERAALEAVVVPLGVRLRRSRLPEQPAQVDEVLLRRRTLLQLRGVPLRNELVRGHLNDSPLALGGSRGPNTPAAGGLAHCHQCTRLGSVDAHPTLREEAEAAAAVRNGTRHATAVIDRNPSTGPESSHSVDWIPVREEVRNGNRSSDPQSMSTGQSVTIALQSAEVLYEADAVGAASDGLSRPAHTVLPCMCRLTRRRWAHPRLQPRAVAPASPSAWLFRVPTPRGRAPPGSGPDAPPSASRARSDSSRVRRSSPAIGSTPAPPAVEEPQLAETAPRVPLSGSLTRSSRPAPGPAPRSECVPAPAAAALPIGGGRPSRTLCRNTRPPADPTLPAQGEPSIGDGGSGPRKKRRPRWTAVAPHRCEQAPHRDRLAQVMLCAKALCLFAVAGTGCGRDRTALSAQD